MQKLKCPNCGHSIPIDQMLEHDIAERTRESLRAEMVQAQEEVTRRENELAKREKLTEQTIKDRISLATQQIRSDEEAKAREAVAGDLTALEEHLKKNAEQLREARANEVALRQRTLELEEKAAALDVEVARRVSEARSTLAEEITERLASEQRLKDADKDRQLATALETVDTLKRKLEQGSQQAQGETLELEIEDSLKSTFPTDVIEPVPKGVNGADVIQRVTAVTGQSLGSIVWEIKRTKSFKEEWLSKLKADQRTVKADIPVLVTQALPEGVTTCAQIEGVWVTSISFAMIIAGILRVQLAEVSNVRQSQMGKKGKMEAMYKYLSGPHFRQRIEAIVEAFTEMSADIAEERRVSERRWSKREKQIAQVVGGTAGMYGDLQGIVGLATIPQLEHSR